MLIPLMLSGCSYTTESTLDPSSDRTTLTNASIGVAAQKRLFMPRDVGVAGFNDHVNSLVDCARPFTIEHLDTYRRADLVPVNAELNTGYKEAVLGSFGLRRTRKAHDAIFTHHCALFTSDHLT